MCASSEAREATARFGGVGGGGQCWEYVFPTSDSFIYMQPGLTAPSMLGAEIRVPSAENEHIPSFYPRLGYNIALDALPAARNVTV